MSNVTFYLGAGASCNVLPLVKQIPDRLQNCIEFLSREELRLGDENIPNRSGQQQSIGVFQDMLIDDLKWLNSESRRHATIDTFAKKLLIRGENTNLNKLKSALIAFFTIEQFKNKSFDPRYDTFYSSIFEYSPRIPDNIRIISWNYDLQLEIALSEYSNTNRLDINANNLSHTSKGHTHYKDDHFKCFKINGTADYIDKFGHRILLSDSPTSDLGLARKVVFNHYSAVERYEYNPLLSFAWEQESKRDGMCVDIVSSVVNDTSATEILVVIGYSFPFFNRKIDRKIISSMQLKKVYIQDINAASIIDRFLAIQPDIQKENIIPIQNDMEQFFIPHEI